MRSLLATLSRHVRDRSVVRPALALTGVVVIAAALVVGPWYLHSHQQAATVGADGVAAAANEALTADEVDSGALARFDTFQIAIPEGWERVRDRESGDGGVMLYLRGPLAGQQHLVVAAQIYPVARGVTLPGFIETYTLGWGLDSFPLERDIKLCGQPARAIGFTNADGDNLMVLCLYKQQVYAIAMVAPTGTMAQHLDVFHEVLGGLQLYE